MTETAVSPLEAFSRYLQRYRSNFALTAAQCAAVELRILRSASESALYRFETLRLMKRKAESQTIAAAESLLLEDIAKASRMSVPDRTPQEARGLSDICNTIIPRSKHLDNSREANWEEFFTSYDGMDEDVARYSTPSTSQAHLTGSSNENDAEEKELARCTAEKMKADIHNLGAGPNMPGREKLSSIAFGVKYFLATMVSKRALEWTELSDQQLALLSNKSSFEAMKQWLKPPLQQEFPKVEKWVTPGVLEACQDLDREHKMLHAGITNLHSQAENWIGGSVDLSAVLSIGVDRTISISLRLPAKKKSFRFSRRFGSARFLRLILPRFMPNKLSSKGQQQLSIKELFSKPFCIAEHKYRTLCVRDRTVHLFELGDDIPSIWNMYDWHGPWQENAEGKLLKYLQRINLGFSASIPGPMILAKDAKVEADTMSSDGTVMTDGAACVSRSVLEEVANLLALPVIPTAIQARYDGAKGMWYAAATKASFDCEEELWINVRDSQRKLQRKMVLEPCHQTIDVLRIARPTTPSSLSQQIILILTCNGVKRQTLIEMQEKQLKGIVDEIFGTEGEPKSRMSLARAFDQAGGVHLAKIRKHLPNLSTAAALTTREAEDWAAKIEAEEIEEEQSEGAPMEPSGSSCQLSTFDKVVEMFRAGFELWESKELTDKAIIATRKLLERKMKSFHIDVDRSTEVFVIPDDSGILEEGEVHLRFGQQCPIDPLTKMRVTVLEGDVLVTRHPCLVPSDIQKVRAVVRKELEAYTDVILFSTKGTCPLAHMLSGGDYDGDTVRVFWEPSLVEPFVNVNLAECQPTISMSDAFDQDVTTVGEFHKQEVETREERLHDMLLAPLQIDDCKGIYGHLHRVAAYMHGSRSQEAVDLAFKFNNSMDGVKNGDRIKKEVLSRDKQTYDRKLPNWAEKGHAIAESFVSRGHNQVIAKRQIRGICILDDLWDHSHQAYNSSVKRLRDKQQSIVFKREEDLVNRYNEAVDKGRLSKAQVIAMNEYCEDMLSKRLAAGQNYAHEKGASKFSPIKKKAGMSRTISRSSIKLNEVRQMYDLWICDKRRAFAIAGIAEQGDSSRHLTDILDRGELDRLHKLLASCLYMRAWALRREYAAFDLAYDHLVFLKAEAVAAREDPQACSVHTSRALVTLPRSTADLLKIGRLSALTSHGGL